MSTHLSHSDSDSFAEVMRNAFHSAVNLDAGMITKSVTDTNKNAKVYVVPCSWMGSLMKYIHQCNSDDPSCPPPGRIEIAPLLSTDAANANANSSANVTPTAQGGSAEPGDSRAARRERWTRIKEAGEQSRRLSQGLEFGKDYTFVGDGLWTLLSNKFGFDVSLHFNVVDQGRNANNTGMGDGDQVTGLIGGGPNLDDAMTGGNRKVVHVPDGDVVVLPRDGKFDYTVISSNSSCDAQGDCSSSGLISEDGSEANANSDVNSLPPLLLLPPSTTSPTGDISIDGLQSDMVLDPNNEVTTPASSDDETGDDDNSSAIKTRKRKRYGSGLGNLGNTCFMNSTLQCLAHTGPLRSYFLSGEYSKDLNKDNPLGTGGELATEFANLLKEMWGIASSCESNNSSSLYGSKHGYRKTSWSTSSVSSNVVYPRNFKYTLGKYAEQFIGYNQHDSQEFATYLLDALHEDTNRISKKPYVEKPEQKKGESDKEAANKAWDLHLQREDSRVLESFMGQVKSRVQCPKAECGRVSTTFDPFMYLSVPLPGTSETTIEITFVSMRAGESMTKLNVTLPKTACMKDLSQRTAELVNEHRPSEDTIDPKNIAIGEVFNREIYRFYTGSDEVSKISERDEIFAYQVASVESIHAELEHDKEQSTVNPKEGKHSIKSRFKLDVSTLTKLNEDWETSLGEYLCQPTTLPSLLNARRRTHEDRMAFHKKVTIFLNRCYACEECNSKTEPVESDSEVDQTDSNVDGKMSPTSTVVSRLGAAVVDDSQSLEELCQTSSVFKNVKTQNDVACLEFCCKKFLQASRNLVKEKKEKFRDGVHIQIQLRKPNILGTTDSACGLPLILRISPNLTVYGLRKLLAKRFSHVMNYGDNDILSSEISKEEKCDGERSSIEESASGESLGFLEECSKELRLFRQVPITCERNFPTAYPSYSSKSGSYRRLGSISDTKTSSIGSQHNAFAMPGDEDEQQTVLDHVGKEGKVQIHFPSKESFNDQKWERHDCLKHKMDGDGKNSTISVLDCIREYCQMEQLEDSEMWYCNKCKEHVCAWKQFHLYRTPPILIIHLKRFHYSPLTHRRDKIDLLVDFPLRGLDLTNEVMNSEDGKEPIYDCYAVSNHFGGLGGGHYTAYALNDEGEWCNFDDSRVTKNIDESEVISSAAYVLYYRRRDVKMDDEVWVDRPMPPSSLVPSTVSSITSTRGGMDIEGEVGVSNGNIVESDMMTNSDGGTLPLIPSADISDIAEGEDMDTSSI